MAAPTPIAARIAASVLAFVVTAGAAYGLISDRAFAYPPLIFVRVAPPIPCRAWNGVYDVHPERVFHCDSQSHRPPDSQREVCEIVDGASFSGVVYCDQLSAGELKARNSMYENNFP